MKEVFNPIKTSIEVTKTILEPVTKPLGEFILFSIKYGPSLEDFSNYRLKKRLEKNNKT